MLSSALEQWRLGFFNQLETVLALEPLFDKLNDVVFSIKDRQGRYLSISEACVERCNLSARHDAIGKTAYDIFPAHMAERYCEQDDQVFSTGLPLTDSLDLTLFSDRSNGWCLSHKFPLRSRDGELVGLACLSQDIVEPSREGLIDKAFADSIDYIRAHFAEGLRVEELAEQAGLSAAQFERRMKKIFQLSPGQFILKTRIDAAATQLLHSEQSIADVALNVGFCDQSALSRQFRQVTGLSPRQYRQMSGKKPI